MCRKWSFEICLALVLGVVAAGPAKAELVGQWKFDEGSGTIAADSSGNGNDGELIGDPQWVGGHFGGALQFTGSPDKVDVAHSPVLNPEDEFTVSVWANLDPIGTGYRSPLTSRDDLPQRGYILYCTPENTWQFWTGNSAGGWDSAGSPAVTFEEWTHVAGTYGGGEKKLYVNGKLAGESNATMPPNTAQVLRVGAGATEGDGNFFFEGMVDDVRVYDHVLSEADIKASMENQGDAIIKAYGPDPRDGAMLEATWVNLTWRAGDSAVSHNVYLSDNVDEVKDSSEFAFTGNQTEEMLIVGFPGFPIPDGLVPGTTYYWRIDEVNDADPDSPWIGDVWSFSVPPREPYNPFPANGAEFVDIDTVFSWAPGFGARLYTVYFGSNPQDVANATEGLPQSAATFDPGTLERDTVYYWRVDAFDGAATHKGNIWDLNTGENGTLQGIENVAGLGFVVVDNFESYNDLPQSDPESNIIWNAWIDGFGSPTNNSKVGYDLPPYAEQTVVYAGRQSMPYFYDSTGGIRSEAMLPLSGNARDWTQDAVDRLSIWYKGLATNSADAMYVALNGTSVVYHDNPAATRQTEWTEWVISLQEFADLGVDLTSVDSITIGVRDRSVGSAIFLAEVRANGAGTLFFDDILLRGLGASVLTMEGTVRDVLSGGGISAKVTVGNVTADEEANGGYFLELWGVNPDNEYPVAVTAGDYFEKRPNVWVDSLYNTRDFLLMPVGLPLNYPVYDFVSLADGRHFYVVDKQIVQTGSDPVPSDKEVLLGDTFMWEYKGVAFCGVGPGTTPRVDVYRYRRQGSDVPAYALKASDLPHGGPWSDWSVPNEVAFHAYPANANEGLAVRRTWHANPGYYSYVIGGSSGTVVWKAKLRPY